MAIDRIEMQEAGENMITITQTGGAVAGLAPGAWRDMADIDAEAPHESLPAWTPFEISPRPDGAGIMAVNSRFTVSVRRTRQSVFGLRPQIVYVLGIENFDESARHDWRDFQRLKNELIGPEAEALELYPAESRLLDPSNYFMLWVFPKGDRIPLGVRQGRDVRTPDEAVAPQRHLEP